MAIVGFVIATFFVVCFAVTSIAVRSVWQLRHEKPLAPVRLFLALSVVGAGLLTTGRTTNQPSAVLTLSGAVLCASLGWHWFYGHFKK